jgi:uncharacterized protein
MRPAQARGRILLAFKVFGVRFNVAQLLKSDIGSSRRYELDEDITTIDAEFETAGRLTGAAQLIRTVDGILVTGRLHIVVRLGCTRCLKPLDLPVDFELEEIFQPSVDIHTGAGIPIVEGQDVGTTIDAHHILDLTEVVRQSLLLAMPMAPICDALCRGICPHCGADLNTEPCTCPPAEADPRMEALRQLL